LQGNYNSDLSFSENVKKVNTFDEVFNFQWTQVQLFIFLAAQIQQSSDTEGE
jgi:hypothetical protein